MRVFLTISFFCAAFALAQPAPPPSPAPVQPGQQPTRPGQTNQPTEDVVFRSSTQLVVQTVSVKDKKGNPIEGLKAKDFVITEDGVAQNIAFLEYQKLEEDVEPPVTIDRVTPRPRLLNSAIAVERPGDLKYSDKRLLALYFDMASMSIPDQLRALDAAQKFIRTQMTKADLIAIMAYTNGEVKVYEDFTADRDRLLSTITTMIVGEDENAPAPEDDGTFGQSGGEFAIFRTDRQLAALQTAAHMLGQLSEKKSLIYFASGMRLNGNDNQAQLRGTINAASKAGVSFFTVDARGLTASSPLGDASRPAAGGVGAYSGASAMTQLTNMQRSQDTLWTLSADTGGKALLDVNDLSLGIVQAQKAINSYYVLGYYATNTNLDGKLRKIKITLTGELSADLDYRTGYYAGKEFKKFSTADKERQLEDALALGDPITELTIAMEVNFFQINNAEYFIPIALKIAGSELVLAKKGGAEHTLIDFLGEIRGGGPVANIRDKIDIPLSAATAAELAKSPITYDTGFTVLPGNYKIKFLARDAETGRIGTYEAAVVIPNLNKVEEQVAISSVVLSSQRVPLQDALFNATKDKTTSQIQQSVNPLVQDNQKLMPSVNRVFSKSKDMYVYMQAYQHGTENPEPLVAFLTFYKGAEKAFETQPVVITERLSNKLNTMPIKFSFPLDKLSTGEYNCQITVLNPNSKKAAFWQAPVMLVP